MSQVGLRFGDRQQAGMFISHYCISSLQALDTSEVALERNVAAAGRVNKRASALYRRGFFTGCWTWLAMVLLILVFVGMIVIIRLT